MTLALWSETVTNGAGTSLPGASVSVREQNPSLPLATIYSDANGNNLLTNPFFVGDDAAGSFYAEPGYYVLIITAIDGTVTRKIVTTGDLNVSGPVSASRMRWKVLTGTAGTSSYDVSGLSIYGGAVVNYNGRNSSSSAQDFNVALSAGAGFAAAYTIAEIPAGSTFSGEFLLDFGSGAIAAGGLTEADSYAASGTVTTPLGTVSDMRFTLGGVDSVSVVIHLQGGAE